MAKQLQKWLDDFVEQCGFNPDEVENWGKENVKINLVMNGNINPYINTSTFIPKKFYRQMKGYWERFDPQPLSLPNVERVEDEAFNEFTYIQELILPKCKYIGEDAFKQGKWTKVEAPECIYLGRRAFGGNKVNKCAYYFPKLEFIGKEAFNLARSYGEQVVIFLEGSTFCALEEKGSLKIDGVDEVIVYVNEKLYNQYLDDPNWAAALEAYNNLTLYYIGQEIPAPVPLPLNECSIDYARRMVRAGNYKDVWKIGDKITLSYCTKYYYQYKTVTATLIHMGQWNGLDVIFQIEPQHIVLNGWNQFNNITIYNYPVVDDCYPRMYSSLSAGYFPTDMKRFDKMSSYWTKDYLIGEQWKVDSYSESSFKDGNLLRKMFVPSIKQLTGQELADNDSSLTDHFQFDYYKTLDLTTLLTVGSEKLLTSSYMDLRESTDWQTSGWNAFYNPTTGEVSTAPNRTSTGTQIYTGIFCFGFAEEVE